MSSRTYHSNNYSIQWQFLPTCRWFHSWNSFAHLEMLLVLQQSLSVYNHCGGRCPAFSYLWSCWQTVRRLCISYLWINPTAIGQRPFNPSNSISTHINTSPRSFPTLVYHEALPAVLPCSFPQIFLVDLIFTTLPKAGSKNLWQPPVDVQGICLQKPSTIKLLSVIHILDR